ncbi:MAG: hypothetical protein JWP25_3587 [Bradyrhizobium sp.]|nr:hypothetical protein [Bradyrhizobium sp.]
MIDRQGGRILIECDSCDEVFEGEKHQEFAEVWKAAKDDGWQSRKIGSEWVHGCGKCGV